MKIALLFVLPFLVGFCPLDLECLNNPLGAGSPLAPNGINNPLSPLGNLYSNQSPNNPYATDPPALYDQDGGYHGEWSANPYRPDSTSNPFGPYGSPYAPESPTNPYGWGSPYNLEPLFVVPQ